MRSPCARLVIPPVVLSALLFASPAFPQSGPSCTAQDPSQRPAPLKQYFMIVIDTSGSMTTAVPAANSCGYPNDRMGHARCAVRQLLERYSDRADFGIAQYAMQSSGGSGACYSGVTATCFQAERATTGSCTGCGPRPGNATTRAGARILAPVSPDSPDAGATLGTFVDNVCGGQPEAGPPIGNTPLNGALRDMQRYFETGWSTPLPDVGPSFVTPLSASDPACRRVNVILLTDGDETCDTPADAVSAAATLFADGVTVGGKNFKVRTFVVNFAGGNIASTNAIAAAGGTGASYLAGNEAQLFQALDAILRVGQEQPNGIDDDCNGCVDDALADVHLTMTGSPDPVLAGAQVGYKLALSSTGPTDTTVLLTGTLPPQTTFESLSAPPGWSCSRPSQGAAGTFACSLSGVQAGDTFPFQLVLAVAPDAADQDALTLVAQALVGELAGTPGTSDPTPADNTASVTVRISNPPNLPPVAEAGPDQNVACGATCTATVTLDGTGSTDPEHQPLTYAWSGPVPASGPTPTVVLGKGVHTYDLAVSDGKSTATDTVKITVFDGTPPVLTPPAPITTATGVGATACGVTLPDLGVAAAPDNCGAPATIERTGVPPNDFFSVGSTFVHYSASDDSHNLSTATQTVSVSDGTPPVLSLVGQAAIRLECRSPFVDPGASANDNCGGDLTSAVIASGGLDTAVPGHYVRSYSASDAAGNSASVSRAVDVVDTGAPVLTLIGSARVVVECHTPFSDPGATATDTCQGDLSRGIVVGGTVNTDVPGSYTRSYSASDAAGNAASVLRTVIVADTTAPQVQTVSASPDVLWPPNHRLVPVSVSASVADLCDPSAHCRIVSVASNEPVGRHGSKEDDDECEDRGHDRQGAPDWVVTGDLTLRLRAERNGRGRGRVYTITLACVDAAGNATTSTVLVTVPHDGHAWGHDDHDRDRDDSQGHRDDHDRDDNDRGRDGR